MYNSEGAGSCTDCHTDVHTGAGPMVPPSLVGFQNVNMEADKPCARCHGNKIFISYMPAYDRCSDCHVVPSGGGE